MRVTVKGLPNLPHVLEGSSDLNSWNPLTTNTPATEVPDGEVREQFYRVVELDQEALGRDSDKWASGPAAKSSTQLSRTDPGD